MAVLVVLSSEAQVKAFIESGRDPSLFKIYCDNERLYTLLLSKNISFEKLDEYLIKDRWKDINAWSCGKASRWIGLCREAGITKGVDYFSVLFLYFSVILMLMLKNHLFAKRLLSDCTPSQIVVFESSAEPAYPDFRGNEWLNYFLREEARLAGIECVVLTSTEKEKNLFPDARAIWKQKLRAGFKSCLRLFWRLLSKPGKSRQFMIYGSIRHLGSTALELKRRGVSLFIYDDNFHKDLFWFALRHRIPYWIRDSFGTKVISMDISQDFKMTIQKGLDLAKKETFFIFDGRDYCDFIEQHIFPRTQTLCADLQAQLAHWEALLDVCPISGLLVEEDFHSRAFLAAYFRYRNIPIFCNSHANLALDSSAPPEEQCFSQSTTFVNSEHEKETYARRGWDPSRIMVTGLPRYDRLAQIQSQTESLLRHARPKILYCATLLWPYCPDVLGYVGCDIFSYKDVQVLTVKALMEAVEGLPLDLVIKPHYTEDEPLWEALLKEMAPKGGYSLLRASRDYLELLGESDAMVLSSWSSTLMEAGMRGIPSFYVDVVGQESSQVQNFANSGLCQIARSAQELRKLFEKLCENNGRWAFDCDPQKKFFYLGFEDGKASERIADFICEKI